MSHDERFTALLADFAAQLGRHALPQADGAYSLAFDERLVVGLSSRPARGQLVMFAALGPPPLAPERIYQALLQANAQVGMVLALDADNHQIVATLHEPLDALDLQGFQDRLRCFVDAADAWRQQIAAAENTDQRALPPSGSVPFDHA